MTSTVSTDTDFFSRALALVLRPKRRPEIPWEYDICHPNDIFTREIIPDEDKIWPYGPNGRKRANTMALTSESMTRVALREKLEIERFITSQLASAHSRIQKECRALLEDNSQLHGVIDGYEAQIQGYEAQMQVYEAELARMRLEREELIDNFKKAAEEFNATSHHSPEVTTSRGTEPTSMFSKLRRPTVVVRQISQILRDSRSKSSLAVSDQSIQKIE